MGKIIKFRKKSEFIDQKPVSFGRLLFEAIPEMWGFQFIMVFLVLAVSTLITRGASALVDSLGTAVTTANMAMLILNWRFPIILIIGFILVSYYIVAELFSLIYMSDDILNGRQVHIFSELKKGFKAVPRFLNPVGLLIFLYIFIAVPTVGIGFSISLTKSFYIPTFIMDVILNTPLYLAAYILVVIVMVIIGTGCIFTLHEVLLNNKTPLEGAKNSITLVKENLKEFLFRVIKLAFITFVVELVLYLIFNVLASLFAESLGLNLPMNYAIDFENIDFDSPEFETVVLVLIYRFVSWTVVLLGDYMNFIATLVLSAVFMLCFTRIYNDFAFTEDTEWLERPKKSGYFRKIAGIILVFAGIIVASAFLTFVYSITGRGEHTNLIAHRTGGTMAPENSIEGLEVAIAHGCYGCETDVQRTKDGYYIINHDNDFARLAGVSKTPQEMTLEEIRQLTLVDSISGKEFKVATLEEMLDTIKGRTKLYIELKGATADRQMVDDVVRIVKEKDCVKDVVLISLKYDVIDYAENTYPEFENGLLFFAGLGDVTNLHFDSLIMEEEMTTDDLVTRIHDKGCKALVWTVNSESSMKKFLNSDVDGIITDEIELAEEVQAQLDARTDFEFAKDRGGELWIN
ncbi:glycerophosphodiester phosphodiesterase family protein [Pseudobutyrivibrio xylanivorans]|uniref:GP-PDE domain-containing protein n=1 Tax=Pseudobutyrivibrio xylanivorans TaxID=185007 RepID=A0A5P6VM16_PSEXY|nr:glycerophosphodiester phosphodiesterase family protein [Pseudobutyrivibrio xylanivorans]QFJ53703.1 hypothetical protein FXF36_01880 [Pseudobutyrivibrio xylanivorans]